MRRPAHPLALAAALALTAGSLLLAPAPATAGPPPADTPVTVPDDHLRECLVNALGLDAGAELTAGMTQDLTSFTCHAARDEEGRVIALTQDLTGLDGFDFSALATLDLGDNYYGLENTDLSPLARLYAPRLTSLDLSSNRLTDAAAVAFHPNLRTLNLRNNRLQDLRPLAQLTHLGEGTTGVALDLANNALTDLSPLGGLPQLSADEILATGQWFDRGYVYVGRTHFAVTRPDGSAVDVVPWNSSDHYDIATGTLVLGYGVAPVQWSDTAVAFSGEVIYYVDYPYDPRTVPAPTATSFTFDVDVVLVAGPGRDVEDTDWIADYQLYAGIDEGLRFWSDATGLDFAVGDRRIVRYQGTEFECRGVQSALSTQRLYELLGTSLARYVVEDNLLFLFYDAGTCDQSPGHGGHAQVLGSALGDGGVIYLTAPHGWAGVAHELGHVFGLAHANRQACTTGETSDPADPWREISGPTGATCTSEEYMDTLGIMGTTGPLLLPAQRFHFGLIHDGDGAVVITEPGEYTVTLDRLTLEGGGTEAAIVFPPYSAKPQAWTGYTVELRPAVGEEGGFTGEAGVAFTTTQFHSYGGSLAKTDLLQPLNGPADRNAALPVGQTATLAQGQISVTVVSQTAAQAVVKITVSPPDLHATVDAAPQEGGEVTLTVDSALPWVLADYPGWVTPLRTTGPAGTTTLTLRVDANADAARRAHLVVAQPGDQTTTVTVDLVQDGDFFATLRALLDLIRQVIERLLALFA